MWYSGKDRNTGDVGESCIRPSNVAHSTVDTEWKLILFNYNVLQLTVGDFVKKA